MQTKSFTIACSLLAIASLSIACTASSQGLSSRNFDTPAKSVAAKSEPAAANPPILNLDISVDAAYAAIPHRRTAMDFAASNMPDQDKKFLQIAFHVIDQAIRLRVTAYQESFKGELSDAQFADFDTLIDYLENTEAPADLTSYKAHIVRALVDQKAFFQEWKDKGEDFQYSSPQTVGSHAKVQSSSAALREGYEILMELYPSEGMVNKAAFFDYHCALDFV